MSEGSKEGGDALVLEILLCVRCMLSDGQVPLDSHVLLTPRPSKPSRFQVSSSSFPLLPEERAPSKKVARESGHDGWEKLTPIKDTLPSLILPSAFCK